MVTANLIPYTEEELIDIKQKYENMLTFCGKISDYDRKRVDAAFELALKAHEGVRRKSGESYIYHPIAVARIVSEEISGLDITSIICALLHDVVEDTPVTLEYIDKEFNPTVAKIIDGLTKIKGMFERKNLANITAENFKKLLLSFGEDIRVIMIKLADRLHNMRTLGSMSEIRQMAIASETLYLYAPIAHRLGLYQIKTELEDLSMKYTDKELYKEIAQKLQETKKSREEYIEKVIEPIESVLTKAGYSKFKVFGRSKHIYSIANKMKKKGIPFEEVYDLFAIRVVMDVEDEKNERAVCFNVLGLITDLFTGLPERYREWIGKNKRSNGYESIHTTVLGPDSKWVEVQIRTKRMDVEAEKGVAAHWKYKGGHSDQKTDTWVNRVRELLSEKAENSIELLNEFRHNLYENEIYIYTPKGDVKYLPLGATVLDFAFEIHTDLGCQCIGAKIEGKLQPISYVLKSGDQVEIITSKKQHPSEQWLNFTHTVRARSKIKSYLHNEKRTTADTGKEILERKLKALKINFNNNVITELVNHFRYSDQLDFLSAIANETFDTSQLKKLKFNGDVLEVPVSEKKPVPLEDGEFLLRGEEINPADISIFGGYADKVDYSIANCCKPVAGDDVFGFITIGKGMRVHRIDCPNAPQLKADYPYRVVTIKWGRQTSEPLYLVTIKINGQDDIGLVNKLTNIISSELKLNMRSISLDAKDGIFEGEINIYVKDRDQVKLVAKKLKSLEGIFSIHITNF